MIAANPPTEQEHTRFAATRERPAPADRRGEYLSEEMSRRGILRGVRRAVVVGGGLGGLAAAVALQSLGCDVEVYEQASVMRREGGSITLWSNGIAALAALGVSVSRPQRIARLVMLDGKGRALLDLDVAAVSERYGHDCINVWRKDLLADLSGAFHGAVHYDKRCVGVAARTDSATARFADGTTVDADLVVVAEGVHSQARGTVWNDREKYAGTTCWEGQVHGTWPALPPASILAIATTSTYAMAFPMPDDTVHWFVDTRQPEHAAGSPDRRSVQERSRTWPDPFPSLAAATPDENLYEIPIFVRRPPRHWFLGRTVLLGDAAHAMGPALGQGGAQAFIDAVALRKALSAAPTLDDALVRYQHARALAVARLWIGSNLTLRMRRTGLLELATRFTPAALSRRSFERSVAPHPLHRETA